MNPNAWLAAIPILFLTGCSWAPQMQDLGLPGSRVQDGYEISADFEDVLDLVPLATVKLDGVKVGLVKTVDLTEDFTARAVMTIASDERVPVGVTASIEQTSLLGEKYVALESPSTALPDHMRDGDIIPLSRTRAAIEVETLLNGASALLNGGGIGHLTVVTRELNEVLAGREDVIRSGLRDLNDMVAALSRRRQDIVRAIEGVDRISQSVASERRIVSGALDELPAGIDALVGQRYALRRALAELETFGRVATRVIGRTKADTVANLRLLDPILSEIAKAAPSFFETLDTLLTYPFARNIYGGMSGDYAQLSGELEIDLASLLRDGFGPGPALGDPQPPIQCGQFGSNCLAGDLTSPPQPPGSEPSTRPGPDVLDGRDFLDGLGGVER
ncbi:MCE family protein [Nocardioides stalactiti]|uniref:MCE family protein n=1 Tax=Nocardioides stalactiti TaxID=2755356 RepID=UPI001601AB96|nr:MCE family protein [Nocardioides stalactiti]